MPLDVLSQRLKVQSGKATQEDMTAAANGIRTAWNDEINTSKGWGQDAT